MDTVDLNLTSPTEVSINSDSYNTVAVSVEDVEKSQVLDHFDVEDIFNHFGREKLLDEIGRDEVIDHFKIQEQE